MLDRLGLVKTSLVDYPGIVSSTVFTHGCSLRCPYCHNPALVAGPVPQEFVSRDEVLAHLDRRRRLIRGVTVTGGEPLEHGDLAALCRAIRARGLLVKVDTNGHYPDRLRALLEQDLLDFVAMDIKTAPRFYERVRGDGTRAAASIRVIQEAGIPHEFRTTVVPSIVSEDDLLAISAYLTPDDPYVLAQYRPGTVLDPGYESVSPYSDGELHRWRAMLAGLGIRCTVRGAGSITADRDAP